MQAREVARRPVDKEAGVQPARFSRPYLIARECHHILRNGRPRPFHVHVAKIVDLLLSERPSNKKKQPK